MLDFDKIYELLRISLITGAINSLFIQKIKCKFLKNDCLIILVSLLTSMLFGYFFTVTFTSFTYEYALWVGIFTFVHAEAIFSVVKKASNISINNNNKNNSEQSTPAVNNENEDDLGEG